jgi:hypothetical protein
MGGVPMNHSASAMPVAARASGRVAYAALRGAIAAMAMTGMRAFTISLGIVEESPPQAIIRQRAKLLIRRVPRKRRRATVELVHWGYGAVGGAIFTVLPKAGRRFAWAGPIYGLLTWAGFEAVIAPAFGLTQAKKRRAAERVALAAAHLLYGLVLSEFRKQPRE